MKRMPACENPKKKKILITFHLIFGETRQSQVIVSVLLTRGGKLQIFKPWARL